MFPSLETDGHSRFAAEMRLRMLGQKVTQFGEKPFPQT